MFWRQDQPQAPEGILLPHQGYVLRAVLVNSRIVCGVRRRVYDLASRYSGRYTNSENRTESIGYEGDDLVINIAFPSEDHATGFGNFIEHLGGEDSPLCTGINLFADNRKYKISDKIWLKDYKPGTDEDTASPPRTFQSGSEVSLIAPSSATAIFQSVEPPAVVKQSCHMYGSKKPKREDLSNHVSTPNNRVCLSPTLHVLYDGYEGGMAPVFAIKPLTIHEEPVVVCGGGVSETRFKVDVVLEFMSVDAKGMFNGGFKAGYVQRSPTESLTWVHVLDPQEFWKFMMWKYEDTKGKWP